MEKAIEWQGKVSTVRDVFIEALHLPQPHRQQMI